MTTNRLLEKYILPIAIFIVAINSIATSIQFKTGMPVANTTIWWIIQLLILGVFFMAKIKFCPQKQVKLMLPITAYLLWNIFSFVYGLFVVDTYWDLKGLIANTMSIMIPGVAYAATNKNVMSSIMAFFLKYGVPFFGVVVLIVYGVGYGYYLAPISFFLLFLPLLSKKWKFIVLALTLVVLLADLGARSNIIKFFVPLCLGLLYYVRHVLSAHVLNAIRLAFLALPLVFFSLAVTDTFNVFKMTEYIEGEYLFEGTEFNGETSNQNLLSDTRTFIYVENLHSAEKNNYWLIGRSPARGYESNWFGYDDMNGRGERLGSEVSILNVFTWTGLVGVFLYFLIFYQASYLAIMASNNIFSKMLGLFIAFRWAYAWVEDFNNFNMFYFMLWLMIGLCFSNSFRSMNNQEVKHWVRGICRKSWRLR
jgi:hypothetical protein